jgi:hypothetical protein
MMPVTSMEPTAKHYALTAYALLAGDQESLETTLLEKGFSLRVEAS